MANGKGKGKGKGKGCLTNGLLALLVVDGAPISMSF